MPVVVVDYDPVWPKTFQQLQDRIWPVVADLALAVEHVGSTSVPGLAAKPVIDLDIVVASEKEIALVIARLATLEYQHRGNLGVEGREAFQPPAHLPKHHLYLCVNNASALRNHLTIRNYLRRNSKAVQEYSTLKKQLAEQFPDDINSYVDGKTDFLLSILRREGLSKELLAEIEKINRKS